MMQQIRTKNNLDEKGNPAGGNASGQGIRIRWQNGPLGWGKDRKSPNGAFVEGVIQAALQRIEFYQSTKFECPENALAIVHLKEALKWLNDRTKKRTEAKIEGTHEVAPPSLV